MCLGCVWVTTQFRSGSFQDLSDTSFPSPCAPLSFLHLPLSCLCFSILLRLHLCLSLFLSHCSVSLLAFQSLSQTRSFSICPFLSLTRSLSLSSLCNFCLSVCRLPPPTPSLSLYLTLCVSVPPFVSESLVFVCACSLLTTLVLPFSPPPPLLPIGRGQRSLDRIGRH